MEVNAQQFENLIQHSVWKKFLSQLQGSAHKLASSLLLIGPAGIGKTLHAIKLFQWVHCQQRSEQDLLPCEQCASCRKVQKSQHSDLIIIKPQGQWHTVDDFREMKTKLYFAPVEGGLRFVIIEDAHALNAAAANALLKTLEEPPHHTKFFLITHNRNTLLPTILSRCQTVNFSPLSAQQIRTEILQLATQQQIQIQENLLNLLQDLCGDGLSRIQELLEENNLNMIRELLAVQFRTYSELVQFAEKLQNESTNLEILLDSCLILSRRIGIDALRKSANTTAWDASQQSLNLIHLQERLKRNANRKLIALETAHQFSEMQKLGSFS